MHNRSSLGIIGENLVAKMLEEKGITILARNYRTKTGEVDLIVTKNNTVAFVEVKTRTDTYFPISNTVTFGKQKKVIRAAKNYILKHAVQEKVLRFDVATVHFKENTYKIEYLPNAFQDTTY